MFTGSHYQNFENYDNIDQSRRAGDADPLG